MVKRLKKRRSQVIPVPPTIFLKTFIEKNGGKIRAVYSMVMTIPYMFKFHTKRKHELVVNLYVIEGNKIATKGTLPSN